MIRTWVDEVACIKKKEENLSWVAKFAHKAASESLGQPQSQVDEQGSYHDLAQEGAIAQFERTARERTCAWPHKEKQFIASPGSFVFFLFTRCCDF